MDINIILIIVVPEVLNNTAEIKIIFYIMKIINLNKLF